MEASVTADPGLVTALEELATLLRCCGEESKAAWVDERRQRVDDPREPDKDGQRLAVRSMLAGMGSLSDRSLTPTSGCGLTGRQVEERQRELAKRLDLLTGGSPRPYVSPRMIPVGRSSTDFEDEQ